MTVRFFPRILVLALIAFMMMSVEAQAESLSFDITRHGDTIGAHTISFTPRPGGGMEVSMDIAVKVTVFGFTAYRFEQRGGEIWEGGRLKQLTMASNDNGDRFKVMAETTPAGRLKTTVNGETTEYDAMPPATLWRAVPRQTTQVLDPVDGKPTRISVSDLGLETITVRGKPVQARHWRWDGEIKRDLWYDSAGTLVQLYIKGDDGSDVFYLLK